MQDLNDKINNGGATAQGQLSADEWNELPSEVQNVIESVGQTLSGGDLTQLVKAIVSYSANGNFFADSGIADAYVLTAIGAKQGLYAYGDGSLVTFIPSFANTGAATVNVSTLGVKDIVNRLGIALTAGDISISAETTLRYDLDNDRFVLATALDRTGGLMTGNIEFLNNKGITGQKVDLTPLPIASINASDEVVIGDDTLPMVLANSNDITIKDLRGIDTKLRKAVIYAQGKISGADGSIFAETGVTSSVRNGVGVYTVTLDASVGLNNPMIVIVTPANGFSAVIVSAVASPIDGNSFLVSIKNNSNTLTDTSFMFTVSATN